MAFIGRDADVWRREACTGTNALPAASVDYDNVLLKASGTAASSGTGGSGSGQQSGGGHGASTGTAVLVGRRLYLRSRCARQAKTRSCKRRFTAVNHRHGRRMSTTAHARIRRGRTRVVSVRLQRAYAKRLAHRRTVLIRERVKKPGHRTNTRYVRYHLRHH